MHIAAERMTPGFVAAVMHYPFRQLGLNSVTGLIHRKNKKSRAFAEHLGAHLRGVLRDASAKGDLMIYQLMREQGLRWCTPRNLRKIHG